MRDQPTQPPRCATLQNVLDALTQMFAAREIDKDLLLNARSAILTYGRIVGKHPSRIKADIVELLDRMDETSALKAGLMPASWSNTKSMLRRALNLAGNPTKRGRRDRPLSATWQRLVLNCAGKEVQTRLSPFAGYCTDQSIEPADVDEDVFVAYATEVVRIARSRNPADAVLKVRRCWNKLVDAFPSELKFRAHVTNRRRHWATPIESMPKPFQDEMAMLKEARSPETFEKLFRCKPLKNAEAVDQFCGFIMRIVTAMNKNGHELSSITSIRYLVEPKHFDATMRRLKELVGVDELRQLGTYASTLRWLADIWVKLGVGKMRELDRVIKVVGRRRAEISDSSLDVLEQLDDPVKREKVTKLAETIASEFEAAGDSVTKFDAQKLRDALFWELGLTTGGRPSSRARINVFEDITWTGRKDRALATIMAGKKAEKTELRRKVELPPLTSRILRLYIDRALPLLRSPSDSENPYLFPGRILGRHATVAHLSEQSERLIARRTQLVGATSHKSRHVSVKVHLSKNPGDWETVQEHVGHRDPEITKKFYANITQVESSKRVHRSMGKK